MPGAALILLGGITPRGVYRDSVEPFDFGLAGSTSVEPFVFGAARADAVEPWAFGDSAVGNSVVEPWLFGHAAGMSVVEPFDLGANVRADAVEPFDFGSSGGARAGGAYIGTVTPSPASPLLGYRDRPL